MWLIPAFFGAPWVYFSTLRAQRTKKFENHCILTKHDAHYIYVCTSVGELFNTPIPYNVTKILITHVLYFNIGYVHELFIFFLFFWHVRFVVEFTVSCSTTTVIKCRAALKTLQAFPFFKPTCLCREPKIDYECNSFRNFLFDHPCNFTQRKGNKYNYWS